VHAHASRLALLAAACALPAALALGAEMEDHAHAHGPAQAQEAQPPAKSADPSQLRFCADPDNLPYSNEKGEGFENKIADVLAKELGVPLSYYWYPYQRGLVRRTLREDHCDVLLGIPREFDPVLTTKAYYRSSYVIASRPQVGIRSLDDPALKKLRIGVHLDTPPWSALGERGMMDNVRGYPLMFDYHSADSSRRPSKLLEDLRDGAIDVAVVWGPMVGYFAKKNGLALTLVPVPEGGRTPMSFDISMGVRKSDKELRSRLDGALERREAEIRKILADYGIPVEQPARHGAL
jgi:mxaJ protein